MGLKNSIFALLLTLIVFPSAASSSDDILIVPQDTSVFQFLDQDLLANDVSNSRVASYTPTSRGTLTFDGVEFTYAPSPEFQAAGMDSFRYVFDQATGDTAQVFLVADFHGDPRLATDLDFEIGSSPGTVIVRSGSLGKDSFAYAEDYSEASLVTDDTEGSAYLRVRLKPAKANKGPSDSGSTLGQDYDPHGLAMPAGAEIKIAAVLVDGEPDLDLILGYDGNSHQLSSRLWRNDVPIEVSSIPVEEGVQSVAVRWWSSSSRESQDAHDGGLTLEVGNKVMASLSSLDRRDAHFPTEIELRFGAMNVGNTTGTLELANLRYRQLGQELPALMPIFADGAESGDTSAWTQTVGTVNVTSAAAIRGSSGISIPATFAAYLIDDSPTGERHYRARYNLDASLLTLAGGSQLTLLTGSDGAGNPFSLELRGQGSTDLELCGKVQSAGMPIDTECYAIDGEHSVEVNWWAALDSQGTGGMILRLKNTSLIGNGLTIIIDDLENHGQSIDEIHFGVISPGAGATGTLDLDDFESWR